MTSDSYVYILLSSLWNQLTSFQYIHLHIYSCLSYHDLIPNNTKLPLKSKRKRKEKMKKTKKDPSTYPLSLLLKITNPSFWPVSSSSFPNFLWIGLLVRTLYTLFRLQMKTPLFTFFSVSFCLLMPWFVITFALSCAWYSITYQTFITVELQYRASISQVGCFRFLLIVAFTDWALDSKILFIVSASSFYACLLFMCIPEPQSLCSVHASLFSMVLAHSMNLI